jgi:hypothetical protein
MSIMSRKLESQGLLHAYCTQLGLSASWVIAHAKPASLGCPGLSEALIYTTVFNGLQNYNHNSLILQSLTESSNLLLVKCFITVFCKT